MAALAQQTAPASLPQQQSIVNIIARAAESPNFDVEKLERLIALKDADEANQAVLFFNNALASAQSEMGVISNDASNPQTHSRYATFAQLDRSIRPIYTRHGFGIQFTEEPAPNAQTLRIVGFLSCGREVRRYMRDIPITTTGIRGQQMSTMTHANMSAATYGRRALLTMMFNLSTDDDDGNGSKTIEGTPVKPQQRGAVGKYRPMQSPQQTDAPFDPETGEIGVPVTLPIVSYNVDGTVEWQSWGAKFIAGVRTATSIEDIDQWKALNTETLTKFENDNKKMFDRLWKAMDDHRAKLEGTNDQGS